MKFLFLRMEELNKLATDLFAKNDEDGFYKVAFSEELKKDVVECYSDNSLEVTNIFPFEEVLPMIEQHFNVSIRKYDVVEVGDFGVGFNFVI